MLVIIKNHPTTLNSELLNQPNSALLFIGEGVLNLVNQDEASSTKRYALKESVLLYSLSNRIPSSVKLISYSEWVELTREYAKIVTLA